MEGGVRKSGVPWLLVLMAAFFGGCAQQVTGAGDLVVTYYYLPG